MREHLPYLILLVLISVVNSAGQIVMRWGGNNATHATERASTYYHWIWTSRWWLFGLLMTWLCGLAWAWCLRRLPLVVAMPIYSGLVYALSIVGSFCILKERMSAVQAMGTLTILVGILLLTLPFSPQPAIDAP